MTSPAPAPPADALPSTARAATSPSPTSPPPPSAPRAGSVAVYTAIYGGYDLLRTHPEIPGVDFYCFTDDPRLASRRDWIVRVEPSDLPPRLAAKRPKILGPQLPPLDAYERTIWVDANCEFTSPAFAREALADLGPDGIALYRNPDLDCLYAQVISCIRGLPPEAAPVLLRQAARYYARGFPEHAGFWACGMMGRRRSPRLDAAMRDWWEAVSSWPTSWPASWPASDPERPGQALPFGLPRDQVDLPPVLDRHQIRPRAWPHPIADSPWWKTRPHGSALGEDPGLRALRALVEAAHAEEPGWCGADKAVQLARLVVELRPRVAVELGAWTGGSAIPIALALCHLGAGQLLAVDAWSAAASAEGVDETSAGWWRALGDAGHDQARRTFVSRLARNRISPDRCRVVRARSDRADVPPEIDLLHVDASHGPGAVADVERWGAAVRVGGVLIVNDLGWPHMRRARDRAIDLGFEEVEPIGTGCAMRRARVVQAPAVQALAAPAAPGPRSPASTSPPPLSRASVTSSASSGSQAKQASPRDPSERPAISSGPRAPVLSRGAARPRRAR